jgi:hypothetical protein
MMKRVKLIDDALSCVKRIKDILQQEFQLKTACSQVDITRNLHGTLYIADLDKRRFLREKLASIIKLDTTGAFRKLFGDRPITVRARNTNHQFCLSCDLQAQIAQRRTTLCHVKIYCKTVQLMMMSSRFDALGSKVDELLYSDTLMDENLREDLFNAENYGMSRVEVSFYGDYAEKAKELETDFTRLVDYLIDSFLNEPSVSNLVCAQVPTRLLIDAYFNVPIFHVVVDRRRLWFVLAHGIDRHHHTGWMKKFKNHEQANELMERFCLPNVEIRLLRYADPSVTVSIRKFGSLFEVPNCTYTPAEFEGRIASTINGLACKTLTDEHLAFIRFEYCEGANNDSRD